MLVTCVVVAAVLAVGQPSYDGVMRPAGDGSWEAYMIPVFASSHASNFVEVGGGSVEMVWFSGGGEGEAGVSIVQASWDGKLDGMWSVPVVVANSTNHSCQNPVLTIADNALTLYYTVQPANNLPPELSRNPEWDGIIHQTTKPLRSATYPPPTIPPYATPGCWTRNRAIDGYLPVYYSYYNLSDQYSAMAVTGVNSDTVYNVTGSNYLIQPTVVADPKGPEHLAAFFRDKRAVSIYRSESYNGGRTWSVPTPTDLPNNDSGIQATVLFSGNLAMVYNPTHSGRDPLVISISPDLGLTWTHTRALENTTASGQSNEYSYPSVYQTTDGKIHCSYTYLRETIKYRVLPDEDWVRN